MNRTLDPHALIEQEALDEPAVEPRARAGGPHLRVVSGSEPAPMLRLDLPGGGSAGLEEDERGERVLRLRDAEGALILEHREGETVLHVPKGDLVLRAPEGDVRIESGGRVDLVGEQGLSLRSSQELSLTARSGEREAQLELKPGAVGLSAERLRTKIGTAEAIFEKVHFFTSTLESVARDVRIKARRYELESERIVERARDAYREAEELSQTRAGRMMLFVDKCLHTVAEDLRLKARQSARVEGEKIYLG